MGCAAALVVGAFDGVRSLAGDGVGSNGGYKMKVYYVRGFDGRNALATFNAGPFSHREQAEHAAQIMLAKPTCASVAIVKVDEDDDDE